eukprot:CAMPEP_0184485426 /NCGR_PEP_ID=MMETSP0113_2-20130426/7038_1 /TAXON_ID=91329 /ORGANISM="Norrisiella sphaerica, Strain BC52" /LENGTH=86 /DNA_ID=CAMNT_0026866865 /DNA_START=102 /DNA_END=358 /DNA_ORIENTATION=-
MKATPFEDILPSASAKTRSLIQRFLEFDPSNRISASVALLDRCFHSEPEPVHHLKLKNIIMAVQHLAAEQRNQTTTFQMDAPFNLG